MSMTRKTETYVVDRLIMFRMSPYDTYLRQIYCMDMCPQMQINLKALEVCTKKKALEEEL